MNKYVVFDPSGRQYEIRATSCRAAIKKALPTGEFKFFWKCPYGITTYYSEKSCKTEPLWAVNKAIS